MTNIYVTEFSEFKENIYEKLKCGHLNVKPTCHPGNTRPLVSATSRAASPRGPAPTAAPSLALPVSSLSVGIGRTRPLGWGTSPNPAAGRWILSSAEEWLSAWHVRPWRLPSCRVPSQIRVCGRGTVGACTLSFHTVFPDQYCDVCLTTFSLGDVSTKRRCWISDVVSTKRRRQFCNVVLTTLSVLCRFNFTTFSVTQICNLKIFQFFHKRFLSNQHQYAGHGQTCGLKFSVYLLTPCPIMGNYASFNVSLSSILDPHVGCKYNAEIALSVISLTYLFILDLKWR